MTKLHIGCADVRLPGYVNIDCRETSATDIVSPAWDIRGVPPGTVSEIYSRHMLEHLDPDDASKALVHWHSLLAPDGVIHVIVPDIEFHAKQLLGLEESKFPDQMQHAHAGFWGWRVESRGGSREDAHRWGYTIATLSKELALAGFHNIRRVVEGTDSEPWHLNLVAAKPSTSANDELPGIEKMELAKYENCDANYYQKLHDQHEAFQQNNWMVPELDTLRQFEATSVVELGCGNGKFLAAAAGHFEKILGVDWARAPAIDATLAAHPNTQFVQADLIEGFPDVGTFDLLLSADFLEHLPTASLPNALARYHDRARFHFHKIACYDDGHSHLTIQDPGDWLAMFKAVSPSYSIFSIEKRHGDSSKLVCCITNHNPCEDYGRGLQATVRAMERSRSWRAMAPYRAVGRLLK